MSEHFLDVSALEPPEPMERILATLQDLPEGDCLKVSHRREPVPLYSILEVMGYAWRTERLAEDQYLIYIWHKQDELAARTPPCTAAT